VFIVYFFFGAYIISRNSKATLNRIFLAFCAALCFWSFGFALANSAPNMEIALLWRRFSAIGWGTVYAIFLHYIIVLTQIRLPFKRFNPLPFLYIPAIITVYAFSLSTTITTAQYNLTEVKYGWINVAIQNNWTFFFQTYYIIYSLAIILILIYWRWTSTNKIIHKQAKLIIFGLLFAILFGSITDVILSSSLATPLPQMAPIFILIPIAIIYYLMNSYSLMLRAGDDKLELILTYVTKIRLYYYFSAIFFTGSILCFLAFFLPHLLDDEINLQHILQTSGVLFIVGLLILILQLVKNDTLKDYLIITLMLFSIPFVTLKYIDYAAITAWAFPLVLIMGSLLFNSRTPLMVITIVAIITQVIVWVYAPVETMWVAGFDYVLRIGIFIIALGIGLFVNDIYRKRLRENSLQIKQQKFISDISFIFANLNLANINNKINDILQQIGNFFTADRVYIFMINPADNIMTYTHEWHREGITPYLGIIPALSLDTFPWSKRQLESNELIYIENQDQLPEEAAAEKMRAIKGGIKSVAAVPLYEKDTLIGFIGLDLIVSSPTWLESHLQLLEIISTQLSDSWVKNKNEREIQYMAYYDQLTGLPNRTLFSDRLDQALHLAKRNEKFIGVVFMDLDSFKAVNDTVGHNAGDTIITEVGQGLVNHLRKSDTVARFGGDEFLLLLNNIDDSENITKVADNFMQLFEKPFIVNGQEFFLTCSAGIAVYPYDGEDAETLIKNADIAMYQAKSRGKNQYALCTTDMKEEVKRNMILSNNLYRAIERDELMLYYQPQIKSSTGEIIGFEALLRWQHPELGMIPPNLFIPIAENNGLINSIGDWVLRTAINQNKKWQDMGVAPLRMAVNLSIVQFNNSRIAENVEQILQEVGLSPEYLELEITESIATREAPYITSILDNFKEIGVSLSIDDFGTEYSSLNRLKMLPIDRIKIDMQFVQGIETNEKDQAIINTIINLAKNLKLEVLAEGVETASQLDFLNRKTCDDVQGYFFYEPMPAQEVEKLLLSQ
ncbi:MAG TPA: EAL domain-containing protein, partial [Syntrophomonadaceae bacterium]|nr:EAL domain-containing protein [Syntrophomonadaceae bacterium]